ncbi:hypothetical protein ACFOPQ_03295 [Deinococcus antarcticus]|uniref:Acetyltransferase (GNAT) family protein n=1 Tax=Deinococcus antarcticus TaxID=1298767 RepID=A0ABV8A268_9DEIO
MTSLELVDITPGNWRALARLQIDGSQSTGHSQRVTVDGSQQGFVANNPLILARAYAYRREGAQVWGIQYMRTPVGLPMQRDYVQDGKTCCDLDRFMIAAEFQGRGLARRP